MAGQTERTSNMVPSIVAKSNAADNADVIVWADPATHRLLVNASVAVSGGSKTNNSAAPTNDNLGVLPAVANAAAPTWTEGNQVLLSTDLTGALRVSATLSGTTDGAAYTAGASTGQVMMGARDDTAPGVVAEDKLGIVRISTRREMYVQLRDAAGNERGLNIDASGQLAITIAAAQTLATVTTVSTVTNLAQMNGAAISMGSGTNGTGVQRVTLATDQAALTTAGLFSVKLDQTTPGTTNAVALAQIGSTTTLGGNGATGAGSLRVTLANDNTGIANWGQGATGAAVPSGAQYKGLMARTTNPSAATSGNLVGAMSDKLGRQVVVVGQVRDLKGNQVTTITSSTTETTVVTAVASTFLDVYGVIVENTSATGTKVTFKDSTAGTTQFEIYAPATDTRGFMLPSSDAFKQTTVNTSWTATCGTSVASIVITVLYVQNI
jgi:hypothetical protein